MSNLNLVEKIHDEILSIVAMHQVDPILLISCCKYATKYFSQREVLYNEECLQKLSKMNNCTKLLGYLGEDKEYKSTLEQCEQYFSYESFHNPLMNELLIAIINLIQLVSPLYLTW